jgi:hypothetical protein
VLTPPPATRVAHVEIEEITMPASVAVAVEVEMEEI